MLHSNLKFKDEGKVQKVKKKTVEQEDISAKKKANELGYTVSNEDDILSEDAVIDLDTVLTMNTESNEENEEEKVYMEENSEEKDYELEDELDDKAEVLASAS